MSTITATDVKNALERYRNSRRKNPGCVYTTETGKHCLAAQIMLDLGQEVPSWEDEHCRTTGVLHLPEEYVSNFTRDALELLDRAQGAADFLPSDGDGGYRTWGSVVRGFLPR